MMHSDTSDARLEQNPLLLLERIRDVYGYIREDALAGLADQLGIPLVDLYSTATFYRSLPMSPPGKHLIRVCKSVPCYLKGNQAIVQAIEDELGIAPGQTSRDGLFSLELVNCIGACDKAPAIMIDEDVFGDLASETVTGILARYR